MIQFMIRFFLTILIFLLAIPAVFLMVDLTKQYFDHTNSVKFADQANLLSALISGLALVAVTITVVLQQKELKLQHIELELNRKELARSATAQENTLKAMYVSIQAEAFKAAMEILQADAVVKAEREQASIATTKVYDPAFRMDPYAHEIVCSAYDTVGYMVLHDMVLQEYILTGRTLRIRQAWNANRKFITLGRTNKNDPGLWVGFEVLAKAAHESDGLPFQTIGSPPPVYSQTE